MSDVGATITWSALLPYFPRLRIARYLRPLPEHGIIYVKNPKAACSTIMAWLDRIHTGETVQFHNVHKEHRLPTVAEVGRPVVERMLSGEAYRFSFVRDPLRRFESVHWDKLVEKRQQWRPEVFAAMGLPLEVSFEQFLSAVEQQDPVSGMNPHWRPQHINLMHPVVSYDRIGRVENFEADLEGIRKEAGLPHVPLGSRNASMHATKDSVYDGRPDLVRRVEQIYAKDFELYGY